MSEATCGSGIEDEPACRFAHAGYVSEYTTVDQMQGYFNLKAHNDFDAQNRPGVERVDCVLGVAAPRPVITK